MTTTPTPNGKMCGCHMEPCTDDDPSDLCSEGTGTYNGQSWYIAYCPTHAAAPIMRDALQRLLAATDLPIGRLFAAAVKDARALLDTLPR